MENITNPTSEDNSSSKRQVIAELLPIAALIVVVNSVVFLLFTKEKRLRKSPTNYLLFSLAVCDFMTGIINIPLSVVVMAELFPPPHEVFLGFFVVVLNNMVVVLVVYHIFAVTVERYLSIACPLRHRQMTKKSSMKIIVVIWMAAILIAFLPFVWFRTFLNSKKASIDMALKIQTGHIIFCIVFVFLLPYVFIIYSQFVMFRTIRRGTLNVGGSRRESAIHGGIVINIKRCLIIFALMAFVNVVCWFPWYVLSIFHNLWFAISEKANTVLLQCSHAFLIIRYLASIINPILYTFFKKDFYEAFKTVILRSKVQPHHHSSLRPLGSVRKSHVILDARSLLTKDKKSELL